MNQFIERLGAIIRFFLILVVVSDASEASFLSSLAACFENPCSCGYSNRTETWGPDNNTMKELSFNSYDYNNPDATDFFPTTAASDASKIFTAKTWPITNSVEPNTLCGPYNRYDGRDGCLVQFDMPNEIIGINYRVYCAEALPTQDFTNPRIRVRMQACDIFSCFTETTTLNGASAECVTWPTQYGVPTIRFCARIAVNNMTPSTNPDGTPILDANGNQVLSYMPDHGYYLHFLDTNGFPRPDVGIQSPGGTYTAYLPKICLYEDPSVVEGLLDWSEAYRCSNVDYNDTSIGNQPLQISAGTDDCKSSTISLGSFMGGGAQNNVVETQYFFNGPGKADYAGYTSLYMHFTSAMTNSVPAAGTGDFTKSYQGWVQDFVVNRKPSPSNSGIAMQGNSLGCVFLPLGPFPPPFCQVLTPVPPTVSIQPICAQEVSIDTSSGSAIMGLAQSTIASPCVRSSVRNNFINNSIRASLDNIVPICSSPTVNTMSTNGTTPPVTSCVNIYPTGYSAALIHTIYNDELPLCSNSAPTDGIPCILTTLSVPACSTCTSHNFRIVYGLMTSISSGLAQINGYPEDIDNTVNCSSTNKSFPCAAVYGINIGQYNDFTFNIPTSVDPTNASCYISGASFSLTDTTISSGATYTVNPYISLAGPSQNVTVSGTTNTYDGCNSCSYVANPPTTPSTCTPSTSMTILDPNSMCVYYTQSASSVSISAGCTPRASPPLVYALNCAEGTACSYTTNCTGSNCSSTSDNPEMVVQLAYPTNLSVDNSSTSTTVSDSTRPKAIVVPTPLSNYGNCVMTPIGACLPSTGLLTTSDASSVQSQCGASTAYTATLPVSTIYSSADDGVITNPTQPTFISAPSQTSLTISNQTGSSSATISSTVYTVTSGCNYTTSTTNGDGSSTSTTVNVSGTVESTTISTSNVTTTTSYTPGNPITQVIQTPNSNGSTTTTTITQDANLTTTSVTNNPNGTTTTVVTNSQGEVTSTITTPDTYSILLDTTTVNSDTITAVVGARNLAGSTYYNIAGLMVDTLVTDSQYFIPPFTDDRNINEGPMTIFGDYSAAFGKNAPNITYPYDSSGNPIASATPSAYYYLGGIEYVLGQYFRGGTLLSAASTNINKCHTPTMSLATNEAAGSGVAYLTYDDTNCVLSTLNYYNTISCATFPNIQKCSASQLYDDSLTTPATAATCPYNSSTSTTINTIGPLTLATTTLPTGSPAIYVNSCISPAQGQCYQTIPSVITANNGMDPFSAGVCQPSVDPANRVIPAPQTASSSASLLGQNYSFSTPGTGVCSPSNVTTSPTSSMNTLNTGGLAYNTANCGIRDKTILERGVSVTIPPQTCAQVNTASSATGYATWTSANVGEFATGTCESGYQPPSGGLHQLQCAIDDNENLTFLPVTASTTCVTENCPAITVPSLASGNATWTSANVGSSATGTCQSGFVPPSGGLQPRACTNGPGNTGVFADITPANSCIFTVAPLPTYPANWNANTLMVTGSATNATISFANTTTLGSTGTSPNNNLLIAIKATDAGSTNYWLCGAQQQFTATITPTTNSTQTYSINLSSNQSGYGWMYFSYYITTTAINNITYQWSNAAMGASQPSGSANTNYIAPTYTNYTDTTYATQLFERLIVNYGYPAILSGSFNLPVGQTAQVVVQVYFQSNFWGNISWSLNHIPALNATNNCTQSP